MCMLRECHALKDSESDEGVEDIVARAKVMQRGRKRKHGIERGARTSEAKPSSNLSVSLCQCILRVNYRRFQYRADNRVQNEEVCQGFVQS